MHPLACKPNAGDAIERLRALYERRATDAIFVTFGVPRENAALGAFATAHPDGECAYPDPSERIAFWYRFLSEKAAGLEDDSLPSAYLSEMDQGLYGGVLGGNVQFNSDASGGWISSMVPRLLQDWSEFERLRFSRSHAWFQRYLRQLDVFARGAEGRFGVSALVLINGMNFVFELVGATDAYMSMLDCPERVHKAIDLGFEVNAAVHDAFFAANPMYHGGTFHYGCEWIPGRSVMESVDPFHMTSVAYFEEWGREPLERIFSRYDGGQVHLHGNGRHLLEAVSTVKGLKVILMGDDKGYAPVSSILDELRLRAGDMPLVVSIGYKDFVAKLERRGLPGGILYHVSDTPDVDTANQCMEAVRAYRR